MRLRDFVSLLLLISALLAFSPLHARVVEAEGSASLEGTTPGQAREMALQQAIRQALVQVAAYVDTATMISESELVIDSGSVSAAGLVKDVVVLEEGAANKLYTVRIRAQVVEERLREPSNAARYRKKVAVTQFQVIDRAQVHDLPAIERTLPRELLRRAENTGAVLAVDATEYLIDPRGRQAYGGIDSSMQENITRIAREVDAQFLVSGVIRDLGERRWLLLKSRQVEIDLELYDGVSGALIARRRINDSVRGGEAFTARAVFGSADFLRTTYGMVLDHVLDDLATGLVDDLNQLPFTARVIRSEGRKVYFNAGATSKVGVGDVLMSYRIGIDPIQDAGNGRFLGLQEQPLATMVVKQVQPLFAVAELEADKIDLKAGDIVRFGW